MREISPNEMKKIELDILIEIDKFCRDNNLKYYLNSGTLLGAVRHKGFIPWDDDIDITMPRVDYEKFFLLFPEKCKNPNLKIISYRDRSSIYPFLKVVNNKTIVIEKTIDPKYQTGVWVDIFPIDGLDSSDAVFSFNDQIRRKYLYLAANPDYATTEVRRYIKKIIKLFNRNRESLYELAERLDRKASEIPIEEGRDIGLIVWSYSSNERMPYQFLESTNLEFEGYFFMAPKLWDCYLKRIYGDYMKLPPKKQRIPHYCEAYWKD